MAAAAVGLLGSSTSSPPTPNLSTPIVSSSSSPSPPSSSSHLSPLASPLSIHQQLQQQQQPPQQQQEQLPKVMHSLRLPNVAPETYQQGEHRPQRWVTRAPGAESRKIGEEQMQVYVPNHPLIKHWISVLRNKHTPPPIFKTALAELGRFLIYEAARDWLLTVRGEMPTPCGVASVDFIDAGEPVRVVPILRAGLVLVEHVSSVLPATQMYHIGFVRDEATLEPNLYLNKLPEKFPDGARVLVADPMLATGGTMITTIDLLKQRNVNHRLIRVVAAVAAPPALTLLSERFPGLRVYTGTIDPFVNERGYIVPGIGDAGDRSFGT